MHIFDANGKDEQTVRLPMTEGLAQIAMLSNKDLTIYYSIATADKALRHGKVLKVLLLKVII